VGRKVPLVPQVAVGLPVKPDAHTAVHVLPATVVLQAGLQPVLLAGTGGKLVAEQAATHDNTAAPHCQCQPEQGLKLLSNGV